MRPNLNDRSAPAEVDFEPGTIIAGKYRLEQVIGEGGMGIVWQARNVVLDFPVAIKLILKEIQAAPTMVERLLVEARIEAKLQHQSIVRVFDFGETDNGSPFIVMELLAGQSLGDLLHVRGKLAPTYAVQLLLPVIDALAHAHDAGVVHRDLKPDNIFLTQSDFGVVPKILDFGIAKLSSGDVPLESTQRGVVMGSPAYMSPEQACGLDDVDQRADVFALSSVLYECVAGRRAFEGKNYHSMLRAVTEDEVVPFSGGEPCESSLWQVLRHGLIKNRNARFQSMRELGSALASWLTLQGVHEDALGVPLSRTFRVDVPMFEDVKTVKVASRNRRAGDGGAAATGARDATPVAPAHSLTPLEIELDISSLHSHSAYGRMSRSRPMFVRSARVAALAVVLLCGGALLAPGSTNTPDTRGLAHQVTPVPANASVAALVLKPDPALLMPDQIEAQEAAAAAEAALPEPTTAAAATPAEEVASSNHRSRRQRDRSTREKLLLLDLKDPY